MTAESKDSPDLSGSITNPRCISAVAIGGGTGLPIVLKSLRGWTDELSAVVTMADDGGSSGRLRQELGVLPPGDIRNCLIALADPECRLIPFFQHRFPEGSSLAQHNLGNLIIAAIAQNKNSFVDAVEEVSQLLEIEGRVFPSTLDNINLVAKVKSGGRISGQAVIARTASLEEVFLEPEDAEAYQLSIEAIERADIIVMAPGSLFTSLIPNLLIKDISRAVKESKAIKIYVLNTVNQRQETLGFSAKDYLSAIYRHSHQDLIDILIANGRSKSRQVKGRRTYKPVSIDGIEDMSVEVVKEDVADDNDQIHHCPKKLSRLFQKIIDRQKERKKERSMI